MLKLDVQGIIIDISKAISGFNGPGAHVMFYKILAFLPARSRRKLNLRTDQLNPGIWFQFQK